MSKPVEVPEPITLRRVGVRVPGLGDLYIDRNRKLQRCKEDRALSRRAQKRVIVEEGWL